VGSHATIRGRKGGRRGGHGHGALACRPPCLWGLRHHHPVVELLPSACVGGTSGSRPHATWVGVCATISGIHLHGCTRTCGSTHARKHARTHASADPPTHAQSSHMHTLAASPPSLPSQCRGLHLPPWCVGHSRKRVWLCMLSCRQQWGWLQPLSQWQLHSGLQQQQQPATTTTSSSSSSSSCSMGLVMVLPLPPAGIMFNTSLRTPPA